MQIQSLSFLLLLDCHFILSSLHITPPHSSCYKLQKKKKSLELSLSAGAEEGWVLSIIKSVLLHQLMGGRGMKVSESFPPH